MLLNIFLGIFIPWLFGIFLFYRDRITLVIMFPVMSMTSLIIVILGHYSGFWTLEPTSHGILAALPFCLGLYPINTCLLIYFIRKHRKYAYALILAAAIFTTVEEALGLLIHKVEYGNGWNIFWTFISYLVPCILDYLYFTYVEKLLSLHTNKQ